MYLGVYKMIFSIEACNANQWKLNASMILIYFCLMDQFFTNILNVENIGIVCAYGWAWAQSIMFS